MASKLEIQLRTLGIDSNYLLVGKFGLKPNDIWIYWIAHTAYLRNFDRSTYRRFVGLKKEAMKKAESEVGAAVKWAPSPFGGRIPSYVLDAAKAYVRNTDVDEFIRPKGMTEHRFRDNPEEERFAKWWGKQNKNYHTLSYLLHPAWDHPGRPPKPSRNDACVAATVIQWLGSECGQAALRELGYVRAEDPQGVLRKIDSMLIELDAPSFLGWGARKKLVNLLNSMKQLLNTGP